MTPDPALQDRLAERFLRYSAISSQSDAAVQTVPTTPGQRELADLLARELRELGAQEVHLSDTSVLTARIPARLPQGHAPVPAVGFCVHLDTVDVNLSPDVRARVVGFDGSEICLNPELDLWLRPSEHPELVPYAGDRLLVTDGTSVLGADDKAGIASVMEAASTLLSDPHAVHGEVHLAFVPDEEIGLRGVRTMDLTRFPVAHAWTLDCCAIGEAVWQTFNAAEATICIQGVTAHPMSAKGVLVNPVLVAHDIVAQLDRGQTPEHTDGTEGYIWVTDVAANPATATLELNIRDHNLQRFEEHKQTLTAAVEQARTMHPRAVVELQINDVYGNIQDALHDENRQAVDLLLEAMEALGIEPRPLAMRGGTDGSWLSRQGILTPNFFTGAHNFHSIHEFLPLRSFEASHLVVLELVRRTALAADRQSRS
ncbi:peptidase T [Luteococcus sp. Sow4_B9]|uniref:peptidase T n=1 Tax=Luteococcus sp. Sow4_B9 TaxID=3438792 RepID=UPI003F996E85